MGCVCGKVPLSGMVLAEGSLTWSFVHSGTDERAQTIPGSQKCVFLWVWGGGGVSLLTRFPCAFTVFRIFEEWNKDRDTAVG
jgi:hypothetical protein